MRGNMKFISSVDQDIAQVSEANEWPHYPQNCNKTQC